MKHIIVEANILDFLVHAQTGESYTKCCNDNFFQYEGYFLMVIVNKLKVIGRELYVELKFFKEKIMAKLAK